ncbi:hypothetical protein [Winogradskyella sp. Asnod2-B02-A]|uniref:hypothetical protein n=1 Tax=Winogradskyella sp. Asnod2-B02-A TaxID=3160583 RepID=UPI00386D4DEA
MKKRIIILGTTLVIVSLLFFSFTKWKSNVAADSNLLNNRDLAIDNKEIHGPNLKAIPDLYYGIDTRFAAVSKSDVHKATSIYTFLNASEKDQIQHIKSVNLVVIKNNQQSELQAFGTTDLLTDAQMKLLRSMDYFNHFTIRTEFRGKNMETGIVEDKFFGPHITVVPDTQATYVDGKEALLQYLKENSLADMNVIKDDKINAIKISFIISKQGDVIEVKHDAMSTGYTSIDEKFMELIKNIPGKWTPAENAKGEKMEQEFVFTFGPRDRC